MLRKTRVKKSMPTAWRSEDTILHELSTFWTAERGAKGWDFVEEKKDRRRGWRIDRRRDISYIFVILQAN